MKGEVNEEENQKRNDEQMMAKDGVGEEKGSEAEEFYSFIHPFQS